jgi:tetratricopeptide (TPR) repeat protein
LDATGSFSGSDLMLNRVENQIGAGDFPLRSALRGGILCVLWLIILCASPAQSPSVTEARRLFAAGSYDRASQLLESSLQSHPDDTDAHLLLGQIFALQGRRTEAIQQFTRTIELEPRSAVAYDTLGVALNRFAEFDLARKAFEQAIALDPALAEAQLNLAMSLAQAGDAPGATEHLREVIRIAPRAPIAATAHYLLAKINEDEDTPGAIAELAEATRIDPRKQEAWLELGTLRRESNDEAGALVAFQKAVACQPRDAESQYELGSEYLDEGDARQAVVHLELARKLMPQVTVAVLYKLDRALRKQGVNNEAQSIRAEAAVLLKQDSKTNEHLLEAQALDHDGVTLESQGETAKALEKYRTALELNPQHNGFRLNYALALCRLGRWQQGIAELNEILAVDPGNIEARRALYIAMDKARKASPVQPGPLSH